MHTKPGPPKGSNKSAALRLKKEKQEEAVERQEAWAALKPEEQRQIIDRRLGKGVGAKKQRARLAKAIAE